MKVYKTNDPESEEHMRRMFGPGQVDQQLRQAIQFCWMMLPQNKRTVEEVEKQLRRMLDRAIKDMRKDLNAFGLK